MFVSLFKPVEMGIHVIIVLIAGVWLHVETAEFDALTESRVESIQISDEPAQPDQKIGPNHMDTFMASISAFEAKLDKEMHDIAESITPEEAEIVLEMLKDDASITPQEFQELVQVLFTPENRAHLTKKGLLPFGQ